MQDADAKTLDPAQLQRLLEVGRSLVSAHDPETVLRRVLDAARDLTGARYAALGVLDAAKRELERFVFVGVDEELRERIGPLPRGHGILGELIRHPEPLRLSRISDHPRSYGFPAEHPPMETFLGAPVMIRGEVYGNLYLTEKGGDAEFDERDEQLVLVLAEWAAVAIDNARSHATSEKRRREVERALRGLEATASLSREVGGETDLDRVLELVVKRGRALVDACWCAVVLLEGEQLRVAAAAGEFPAAMVGETLRGANGAAVETLRAVATQKSAARAVSNLDAVGVGSQTAVLCALRSRGRALGVLIATEPEAEDSSFSPDDELALDSFATSAATAIAATQRVEGEKLRLTIAASERERRRWARELHDETLQDLGALRVMQESALGLDEPETMRRALTHANEQVESLIDGLQGLITDLRPAALDQLGIDAAVEALVDRIRSRAGIKIEVDLDLGPEIDGAPMRFDEELEATAYRLVQEALTNVIKHAGANRVQVAIEVRGDHLALTIEDDGRGFDPTRSAGGYGLIGMRERVELAGGELRVGPGKGAGTRVSASLPLSRSPPGPWIASESG